MKSTTPRPAIRLSITPEVGRALRKAKKLYPTLSDPEILKLGLAKITTSDGAGIERKELEESRRASAYSVGYDYLSDPEEDIYNLDMGKKVDFS